MELRLLPLVGLLRVYSLIFPGLLYVCRELFRNIRGQPFNKEKEHEKKRRCSEALHKKSHDKQTMHLKSLFDISLSYLHILSVLIFFSNLDVCGKKDSGIILQQF